MNHELKKARIRALSRLGDGEQKRDGGGGEEE